MHAGERLKEIRSRLGITVREVEELSRKISQIKRNGEFFISHGWLTQIENRECIPNIYHLYSLAVIYRMKFTDLLVLYDVDLEEIGQHQLSTPLSRTHLADLSIYDAERHIDFPVRFDPGFALDRTSLLSRVFETWAPVPLALLQHLNLQRGHYGYVGLADYTLYPLLQPGSFVQIDVGDNKIQNAGWQNEFDRPIYFVELRNAYVCSWCELQGSKLLLVPHPISGCETLHVAYPNEAEIIGRVVGVAMRIDRQRRYGPIENAKRLMPS